MKQLPTPWLADKVYVCVREREEGKESEGREKDMGGGRMMDMPRCHNFSNI